MEGWEKCKCLKREFDEILRNTKKKSSEVKVWEVNC